MKFKKSHAHQIYIAYEAVGLSSCRTLELSDYRSDPLYTIALRQVYMFYWNVFKTKKRIHFLQIVFLSLLEIKLTYVLSEKSFYSQAKSLNAKSKAIVIVL